MITTCPNCETRYNIDPELLAPNGRIVRCVRCGHTWTERPPGDVPASVGALPVPDVDGDIGASVLQETGRSGRRGAAEAQRGSIGQIVGWSALAAVIVLIVGGGWFGRDWIVVQWPPAAGFYSVVGLSVGQVGVGLDIRNVTSTQQIENNRPTLVVVGEIVNNSGEARPVPMLRGSLLDVRKREIFSWTFSAAQNELAPTQMTAFDTQVPDPPEAARSLEVEFFASEQEG